MSANQSWCRNLANGATFLTAVLALASGVRYLVRNSGSRSGVDQVTYSVLDDWQRYSSVGHRMGLIQAKVKVVVFFDYECPVCRRVAPDLELLIDRHPKDVAIVYRHLPSGSVNSHLAVRATECAAGLGHFVPIHRAVLAGSHSPEPWEWRKWVADGLLSNRAVDEFGACMDTEREHAVIRRDVAVADELGLRGTPSFLINNVLVEGYPGFEELDELVAQAAKQADPLPERGR